MKTKENFVLREVAGSWVVLPIGAATVDFSGMLTLNESGAMLWKKMEAGANENAMVDALCEEYDVDREQAAQDVKEYLKTLREAGYLED